MTLRHAASTKKTPQLFVFFIFCTSYRARETCERRSSIASLTSRFPSPPADDDAATAGGGEDAEPTAGAASSPPAPSAGGASCDPPTVLILQEKKPNTTTHPRHLIWRARSHLEQSCDGTGTSRPYSAATKVRCAREANFAEKRDAPLRPGARHHLLLKFADFLAELGVALLGLRAGAGEMVRWSR